MVQSVAECPPCITVGLRPQLEVFETLSPLELKVIYLGEPLPLVTWRKDDQIITNTDTIKSKSNSSVLYLDRGVQAEDAGLYTCTVENSHGKVETRCQLTVSPNKPNMTTMMAQKQPAGLRPCPPVVLEHLRSVQALDGTEIELSCKIVCPTASFDVVWIHNGKEIKPSKDFQYHSFSDSNLYTLKIPELFPEDSGIYTCEAFNDFGETFTCCSVCVTCPGMNGTASDPISVIKTFPNSTSVTRGAPCVVVAELEPGCDRQVSWIKDKCVIDQVLVKAETSKVQFSLVEAGLHDTGLYEMQVEILNAAQKPCVVTAAFAINVL